ncbi:fibronectin type III domain-containing protein [Galbibacter sp. PAP.153]|uniref:fibronectin type III domain-containing protein n=1 Tax=Galbibacter sp. PAP.153 TaxID=3104623 RepID=UPI00300B58BF
MKKLNFLYIVTIALFTIACGGSDDGPDPEPKPKPEPVNNIPSIPHLDYPTEDLVCIDSEVNFKWLASTDKDGDKIMYQIQISNKSDFSTTAYNDLTPDLNKTYALPKGKIFYWRVKATDNNEGESKYTNASRFFTERDAETNQVPNQPVIIAPANNTSVSSNMITLKWEGTDPDNDAVTFDLYFGKHMDSLPIISESAKQNNYQATLEPNTTYYWRVIVKDDKGGVTIGSLWSFTTN